jgi:predicted nucleotidyltransferase
MRNLKEIEHILLEHKTRLFEKYPIKSLAIFGSFSRGDFHKESDLDILVEFNVSVGIEFIDLAEELEDLLGIRVDLVSKVGVKAPYLESLSKELVYV